MSSLPEQIYTVESVRAIDRAAVDGEGILGYTLMSRAGEAALRVARKRFAGARRWQVICGAGNNAGDGYVVARLAAAGGIATSVVAMTDPAALTADAATAHREFAAAGGVAQLWADAGGSLDPEADLLVDALLGSGLERDVEGAFGDAVAAMNAHPAPVVAVDIPTGLHGDDGAVMGCAVEAAMTVTFAGLKAGLFLGAGPAVCGEVRYDGLGIPERCRSGQPVAFRRISSAFLDRMLPRRPRDAHKGRFGHVLVVGGAEGMPGAVRLSGEAALRAGAGLVSIATHPGHAAAIAAARPELMCHAIGDAGQLPRLIEKADVLAFGPGLGQSTWARDLYAEVERSTLPSVWDADALNLLAASPGEAVRRIITPHPGEAGRLLGISAAELQRDRTAAVQALAARYGGTAVLKGAGTLVSSAGDTPSLCTHGNPGMATAGMGDVLTGVIAGLLAQGLNPADAAAAGVELHARAGDSAAVDGERGLMASDLIAALRAIVNRQ